MNNLQPDYAASLDFLRRFHPGRRWVLTGITPDKKSIVTNTFDESRAAACIAWLEKYGATHNLYFSVGEVSRDVAKKAERTDIANVWWLHVDVDPRAGEDLAQEQTRALGLLQNPPGLPPPTAIVYSGGGYQGFWQLREPIAIGCDLAKAEDAKLYNLHIELALGADNVHDISRIMRLPGTLNRPDEKKAAKGRSVALAVLAEWHPERVYDLGQFAKSRPVAAAAPADSPKVNLSGTVKRLASVDELPIADRAKVVIVQGLDPDEPNKFPGRSEWLFHACCAMVRGGCDDNTIYSVITDARFGISASVLDKGGRVDAYARRQIERAREADTDFDKNDKGVPFPSQANIRRALRKLGVWVGYDEFADKLLIRGLPEHTRPFLNDSALKQLWLKVDASYQLRPGFDFFMTVVEVAARENAYHPVRDYLASLKWDGVPRLDKWLVTYGGAADSEFNRAVGPLVLIAAVRRVRQPGCKFDEMLVLESPQGQGKSTALRVLAARDDWFSDDLPLNADTKRQIEALAGRWIVEAGELKGMRKGDVESLKGFLSRQVDSARVAYGRLPNDYPRQCVIVGTTNSEKYLKDDTGNRRFWPVAVATFDLAALRRDRDQLWAEAAQREAQGESIRLDPKFYGVAAAAQEQRLSEHAFWEVLEPIFGDPDLNGKIHTDHVWALLGKADVGKRSQEDIDKRGAIMKRLGWEYDQLRINGKRPHGYQRGTADQRTKLLAAEGSPDGWRVVEVPPGRTAEDYRQALLGSAPPL